MYKLTRLEQKGTVVNKEFELNIELFRIIDKSVDRSLYSIYVYVFWFWSFSTVYDLSHVTRTAVGWQRPYVFRVLDEQALSAGTPL